MSIVGIGIGDVWNTKWCGKVKSLRISSLFIEVTSVFERAVHTVCTGKFCVSRVLRFSHKKVLLILYLVFAVMIISRYRFLANYSRGL